MIGRNRKTQARKIVSRGVDITKAATDVADERLFDNWFDPVEKVLRTKVRGFIETMIEG
jgi:hypothetical protein